MLAFLIVALTQLAVVQTQETARDAYLEGWFAETASADLESALKHYRHCVEIARDQERDVKARALLRIAVIERAQGNEPEARAGLEELVKSYADTAAGAEAKRALAGPSEPGAVRQPQAIDEARAMLRELLLMSKDDRRKIDPKPRLQVIFRNLSVDQVLAECAHTGQSVSKLVRFVEETEFRGQLEDLARKGDDATKAAALDKLLRHNDWPLPQDFLDRLADLESKSAEVVLTAMIRRRDDASLATAETLVRTNAYLESTGRSSERNTWLGWLAYNREPRAASLLQLLLRDRPRIAALDIHDHISWLAPATPAASWLREQWRTLPAALRMETASKLGTSNAPEETVRQVTHELLDLLTSDPEPDIRLQALIFMMRRGGDLATESLERSQREAEPERRALLIEALKVANPPFAARALIEAAEGALREGVYHALLRPVDVPLTEDRHPVQVVRLGLERGDPELLSAALTPRSSPQEQSWQFGALLPDENRSPRPPTLFQDRLAAAPDPELTARLVRAAAQSPSVEVRRRVPALVRSLPAKQGLEFYADLAGQDPSPEVRAVAAEMLDPASFSHDVELRLMQDPAGPIAEAMIKRCADPQWLAEAAREVSPLHLATVFATARELGATDAVRAVYARVEPDSQLAIDCFNHLVVDDITVAVDALLSDSRSLRFQGLVRLRKLRGLDSGVANLLVDDELLNYRPQIVQKVRAQLDLIERAFHKQRIADLVASAATDYTNSRTIGRKLASLDAREELRELLHGPSSSQVRAGAFGLATVGEKQPIAEALQSTLNPDVLVDPALEAGLEKELIALLRLDRGSLGGLPQTLDQRGRVDACIDVLLDPPARLVPYWSGQPIDSAVRLLVDRHDAERLDKLVDLYGWPVAVRALLQLKAYDQVLGRIRGWPNQAQATAIAELQVLTGHPDGKPQWPRFREEQDALVRTWAKDLGVTLKD